MYARNKNSSNLSILIGANFMIEKHEERIFSIDEDIKSKIPSLN